MVLVASFQEEGAHRIEILNYIQKDTQIEVRVLHGIAVKELIRAGKIIFNNGTVVTKLFNITVNDFDEKKSAR